MPKGERTLAAIMFTDIVGYTHLSQTDESLALELLEEHRVLLRPIIAANRGAEVKTIGDAFLVQFKSTLDALRCGVEIQHKLEERNRDVIPSRKLELRIGIHVGDVVRQKHDIVGDAVNVASRIEPLARPGGICISQQVFDQVRNKTDLDIVKLGDLRLKNVDLPVTVYGVGKADGQSSVESREGNRVCVLPFVNISPESREDYFADGLTEELILKLSENPSLKVIARTSAMSYKGKDKKVSEIARELGVDSVIEGSVRKAGRRVRIAVQLIDARTEEHLWSAKYDSRLTDIFAIQSEVASKVADSLAGGLFEKGTPKETHDVEVYTTYLRATQLLHESTGPSIRKAMLLLENALAKDPSYARAYTGISRGWGMLAGAGLEDFSLAVSKAETAARKALELGPDLAEAHSVMSMVHFMNDRGSEAVDEAEQTLRINPNDVEAHVALGILYSMLRTPEEGLREFKIAYELDPLSVVAGDMMASAAGMMGLDELEGDVLSKLLRFYPTNPRVLVSVAEFEMARKNFAQAQRLLEDARRYGPSEPIVKFAHGELYGLSGRKKEAKAVLVEIRKDEKESARLMGELVVSTALGDLDAAFGALMRLAEIHAWPYLVAIDPFYSEIRKDPRFAEFRKTVGLPHWTDRKTVPSRPERREDHRVRLKSPSQHRRQVVR